MQRFLRFSRLRPTDLTFVSGNAARVDFNTADPNGVISIIRERFTGMSPSLGDLLELSDGEGNRAQATVLRVGPRFLTAAIEWETWLDNESISSESAFLSAAPQIPEDGKPETTVTR
jgi:hypothetical protein